MHIVERDEDLRWILGSAYTVAVLGAHPDPKRPAHYVPA
ncbi:MAG TPA: CoA-binding protein, partial [Oceanithermus profundus]|nr:CoA-binding protein [Oceanithermus profundus]